MSFVTYLLAATLSESAELALYRYRRELFRSHGLVSALALPPLVPLAWRDNRPIADQVPYIAAPEGDGVFRSTRPKMIDGAWFLEMGTEPASGKASANAPVPGGRGDGANVDGSSDIPALWQRALHQQEFLDDAPGWFPVFPGIFLCMDEHIDESLTTDGQAEADISEHLFQETCRLNDFRIACFRLTAAASRRWWEDLVVTRLWSKHITG